MNDQAIEQQIQAKGKTAARVTPADIEANIASTHYFTAEQGAAMATADQTGEAAHPQPPALRLLTFCVLILQNGFTVTGESACASPENFDAEIGRNIARQNAVQKIWPLMGYQLRDELHRRIKFAAEPQTSDQARIEQHVDMVRKSGWTPGDGAGQQTAAIETKVYSDGTKATGPAPLPETSPLVARAAHLPPHQKRVIDEKRELDERKDKLAAFFETTTFAQLDDSEQGRLHAQHAAMVDYSRVLGERIEAFTALVEA